MLEKMANENLVLLFGLPRSGTTWIGKILDSSPRTIYKHEPDTDIKMNGIPHYPHLEDFSEYHQTLNSYLKQVKQANSAFVVGKLPLFKKGYLNLATNKVLKLSIYVSKVCKKYFSINVPILSMVSRNTFLNNSLVWKSIESVSRLGVLADVFPQAKITLIIRHPCGHILSYIKGTEMKKMHVVNGDSVDEKVWNRRLSTKQAKSYGLTLDKIKKMNKIEELSWIWVISNEEAITALEGNLNAQILYYDDFCAEPLKASKSLFKFSGVDWSEQSEAFVMESIARSDQEYFSVYKTPLVVANKWRTTLQKEHIETIRNIISQSKLADKYQKSFDIIES